jgi:hypothetical protein
VTCTAKPLRTAATLRQDEHPIAPEASFSAERRWKSLGKWKIAANIVA